MWLRGKNIRSALLEWRIDKTTYFAVTHTVTKLCKLAEQQLNKLCPVHKRVNVTCLQALVCFLISRRELNKPKTTGVKSTHAVGLKQITYWIHSKTFACTQQLCHLSAMLGDLVLPVSQPHRNIPEKPRCTQKNNSQSKDGSTARDTVTFSFTF